MGAVMGSKRLKAVAVRGSGKMLLHDEQAVRSINKAITEALRTNDGARLLGELGSACYIGMANAEGILPTQNFVYGSFAEAMNLSGETMKEQILTGRGSCYGCPVRCKRQVQDNSPYPLEPEYGGPEYESMAALGPLCRVGDLKAVAYANQLCQAYSLDNISTGVAIAFAME
jgi:aldehyde:ferredoxin oxidoreductase